MPRTAKPELTAESIIAAIEKEKPGGITKLARALGYQGSVSSWLKSKMIELVPDLADRIQNNKGSDGGKTPPKADTPPVTIAVRKQGKGDDEAEKLCPFKRGKYRFIWLLLYRHRVTGITRERVLDAMEKAGVSDRKTGYYALTVVASPTREGAAHRSASVGADLYFCEKQPGGNIRLHLRDRKF